MAHVLRLHSEWESLSDQQTADLGPKHELPIPSVPADWELQNAAFEAGFELLNRNLDSKRRASAAADPTTWAAYREERRQRFQAWEQRFAGQQWGEWERVADRLIEIRRWEVARDGDQYRNFVRMIAEAFMDGLRAASARDAALPDPQPTSRTTRLAMERLSASGEHAETILDLLAHYRTRRLAEGLREDTVDQDRKVLELFAEFVGPTRPVAAISPIDVRDFRDTIAKLPANYRKRREYAGLNIRDAAEKAGRKGDLPLSPTTVSKYMSTVSPFFAWLKADLRVSANPCDGLHVKPKKRQNTRPPFSVLQLNTILCSPLFVGFERDGKEHKPGKTQARDWRFWVPLLCLFTGARIGEAAQLRLEDVREQEEGWFLFFREDRKSGQRTKSREARAVAVHPILQAIGFIDFVADARRKQATGPLFDLTANERGHVGATPSRFFRDYLERIGVKERRDGLGSHSFRHGLTDYLRAADFLDHEIGPLILGHSDGRTAVTGGYGALPQGTARRLQNMIRSLQFDGVSFKHLMRQSSATDLAC